MMTDMTTGKISRVLWTFSIPMLVSVMFQQIYNIADSMIAGRFVGEDALAAVGASYPITMIFMAIAMGCNIGCSVVISQLFGGKQYANMKTAITTTFIASGVVSVILTVSGLLLSGRMLVWLNTPENIFADSATYLNIYIGGLVFLFLYNICTGIFTALGDSKTPLYFLIGSSVGNIILDIVLVTVIPMGVAGVAWATFIAQGVAGILPVITLMKRILAIKTEEKHEMFSWPMLGRISVIAVPSILQQSFISIGNIFIQVLVNGYGSAAIAGYSAAIKLNTFGIASFTTLANGISSFTAQNLGAGKIDRVKKGFWSGSLMAFLVVLVFFGAYFFFDRQMIHLFLDTGSTTAMEVGRQFLKIVSPFYFVIALKLMADGVLRGAGSMGYFMVTTFSDLILRVVLSYILSSGLDMTGIWLSWPIGWVIAAVLSCIFYGMGVWKKRWMTMAEE